MKKKTIILCIIILIIIGVIILLITKYNKLTTNKQVLGIDGNDLLTENQDLEKEEPDSQIENQDLNVENEALETEYNKLKKENQNLKTENQNLKAENQDLELKYKNEHCKYETDLYINRILDEDLDKQPFSEGYKWNHHIDGGYATNLGHCIVYQSYDDGKDLRDNRYRRTIYYKIEDRDSDIIIFDCNYTEGDGSEGKEGACNRKSYDKKLKEIGVYDRK